MARRRIPLAGLPVAATRNPVTTWQDDSAGKTDPETLERRTLYDSPRWKAVRRAQLTAEPRCAVCRKYANTCDHLLGHDDEAALYATHFLRLDGTAAPSWRDRFFAGPFISLCQECHSRKTRAEMSGRLYEWVRNWKQIKG